MSQLQSPGYLNFSQSGFSKWTPFPHFHWRSSNTEDGVSGHRLWLSKWPFLEKVMHVALVLSWDRGQSWNKVKQALFFKK